MPHITFIHGIANKPEQKVLLKIWKNALANHLLGNHDAINLDEESITSSMIYWADVLYESPLESPIETDTSRGIEVEDDSRGGEEDWEDTLPADEKAFVNSLELKLEVATIDEGIGMDDDRGIPLPMFMKKPLMKILLRDVHHYLFNAESNPRMGDSFMVQDEIRNRVIEHLNSVQTDKHIVVSHSMGTVIMYDCLKRVEDCPKIDGFLTIGSPLGLDEIQEKCKPEWTRENGFPEKITGNWINIYDPLDPVALFDGNIANDYKKEGDEVIEVIKESNEGTWRHDIEKYLSRPLLRDALRRLLED